MQPVSLRPFRSTCLDMQRQRVTQPLKIVVRAVVRQVIVNHDHAAGASTSSDTASSSGIACDLLTGVPGGLLINAVDRGTHLHIVLA